MQAHAEPFDEPDQASRRELGEVFCARFLKVTLGEFQAGALGFGEGSRIGAGLLISHVRLPVGALGCGGSWGSGHGSPDSCH